MPIRIMQGLFSIINPIYYQLQDKYKKLLVPRMFQFIQKRIRSIDEKEIKDLDKDEVLMAIRVAAELAQKHFEKQFVH